MRIPLSLTVLAAPMFWACAETSNTPAEPASVVVPLFAHVNGDQHKNFATHATGAEEVPVRETDAQGQAFFQLNADGTELRYKLIVANILNVTQSHIHLAPAGSNGNIVVWLYPSGPPSRLIPGRSQGVLMEGVITAANLVNDLAGKQLSDLLAAMRAGNTYVNVHTSQFPPGEIRGQID